MYPLLFIARNNLKKKKGEVVVLFFLIALAALLLYTSVSVLTGVGPVLDAAHERADTADFLFMTQVERERIKEIFLEQEEVTDYEMTQCLFFEGSFRAAQSVPKSDYAFIVGAMEDQRTIGRLPDLDMAAMEHDSVLLPYYLKTAFDLGDSFYLTLGEQEYTFKVAGFVEDPLFATPLNISSYSIYITRNYMDELTAANPSAGEAVSWQHKMHLKEGTDTAAFDEKVSLILVKAFPELSQTPNLGVDWMTMRGGASILSNISMGIIFLFSVLLILVALLIVRFSIRNFLELNLKNIGILQASGYTVRQLQLVSVLEMSFTAFWGILAGIILGILGNGVIGSIEGSMIGIGWSSRFHPDTACLTMLAVFLAVTGTAVMAGRVYGRLTVLNALRGGIHTHNFRKNYFPLEKSRLPFSLVLAGKNILGEKIKNLSVFCIVVLLSLTTCIGFALYDNFAADSDMILRIVGIENVDVSVTGEHLDDAGRQIEEWEETESVLYYSEANLRISRGKKHKGTSCDSWKDPQLLHYEMIVRGRLPRYDNEIVLTTRLAEILEAEAGDVVYVEGQKERLAYIVSGIDQKIDHMGIKALLTREGLERLNSSAQTEALYIYTKEGVPFGRMKEKLSERFPQLQAANSAQVVAETTSSVTAGMAVICMVFAAITFLVVTMVEVLLIHTKLRKERKNYGISKALGYTTGQLVHQTMMMNMPVILIGSAAGAGLSSFLINPLARVFFSIFGFEQCSLIVRPCWMFLTTAGIVLTAAGASLLASIRIRRIAPVEMLSED